VFLNGNRIRAFATIANKLMVFISLPTQVVAIFKSYCEIMTDPAIICVGPSVVEMVVSSDIGHVLTGSYCSHRMSRPHDLPLEIADWAITVAILIFDVPIWQPAPAIASKRHYY